MILIESDIKVGMAQPVQEVAKNLRCHLIILCHLPIDYFDPIFTVHLFPRLYKSKWLDNGLWYLWDQLIDSTSSSIIPVEFKNLYRLVKCQPSKDRGYFFW